MSRAVTWTLACTLAIAAAFLLWTQIAKWPAGTDQRLPLAQILGDTEDGFAPADGEWDLRFPADHGAHPDFRSEVWSLAGILKDANGRRFGFQLSFFRLALAPEALQRESAWASHQVYRAHFTLTDARGGGLRAAERFSRPALGLAGATAAPVRVWLEDWVLEATDETKGIEGFHLQAQTSDMSLNLQLSSTKPVLRQGDVDILDTDPGARGAFHFYLMPRLVAAGTLGLSGESVAVEGKAWLDRAWGAVPMASGQLAMNRLTLQLSDSRDLLCLQLRRRDGSGTPIPSCIVVGPDGSARRLDRRDVSLEPTGGGWSSPVDGTAYPLRWRLLLPAEGLDLDLVPLVEDQELNLSLRTWSGAVSGRARSGELDGWGYLELSGYAETDVGAPAGRGNPG